MVRTAGAGSGFLALTIDGPSKVALSCKEVDEGYEFSYTPFCPGKYLIAIKYGNVNLAGSPYVADITGKTNYLRVILYNKKSEGWWVKFEIIKIQWFK